MNDFDLFFDKENTKNMIYNDRSAALVIILVSPAGGLVLPLRAIRKMKLDDDNECSFISFRSITN